MNVYATTFPSFPAVVMCVVVPGCVSVTDASPRNALPPLNGVVLARAPAAGQYPDGLAYDPVERHVFVSDESGGVETVIGAGGRRLTAIRSAARPATSSTTVDPRTHRVYFALEKGASGKPELLVMRPS